MYTPPPVPVIIEPFSTFGDEVAGATADEVARNLAAATRTSLAWRCRVRRPLPDLRALFRGQRLSADAERALREVDAEYTRLALQETDVPPLLPPPPPPLPVAATTGAGSVQPTLF